MVRFLVAVGVVFLLAGAARAERLCRFEPPRPAADGPICTGQLDDGPACRGPGPGHPLPPAMLILAQRPSLTTPALAPLGGPAVRLLPRWRGALGGACPGYPPSIDRPPKSFSV